MAYGIKDFDTIVSDMIAHILTQSSSISDFSPGSVMRSFTEGAAIALEDFYVSVYTGFKDYLQNIQKYVFDFPQKTGSKATASVVFSRSDTTEEATIPEGTAVETATGLKFFTQAEVVISAAVADSDPVTVEAEDVGLSYNVGSASINIISDAVPNVDTVVNALPAQGGISAESDIAYKTRFQEYVEGLAGSNKAGLIAAALGVEGIVSASLIEHFPPVSDVNVTLYIDNGQVDGVSSEKIAEVQGIIDGDGTDDNPGYRAAGVYAVVEAPSVVLQNITAIIYISEDVDQDNVRLSITDAISYYMNNLGVGSDMVFNELVAAIMEVYGVYDCTISVPSSNVSVSSNQVVRPGTFTMSFIEVAE
jgi:uncharacterized phage protein gp47/JayE